jgi:hypothetical protein
MIQRPYVHSPSNRLSAGKSSRIAINTPMALAKTSQNKACAAALTTGLGALLGNVSASDLINSPIVHF